MGKFVLIARSALCCHNYLTPFSIAETTVLTAHVSLLLAKSDPYTHIYQKVEWESSRTM